MGKRADNFLARLRRQVGEQRKWIEECEACTVSYTGENGPEIRRADRNALRELETRLGEWEGRLK